MAAALEELGTPIQRANFRLMIFLFSYLVGLEVFDRDAVAGRLEDIAGQASDEQEASLIRSIAVSLKSNLPPRFEVIDGGKDK